METERFQGIHLVLIFSKFITLYDFTEANRTYARKCSIAVCTEIIVIMPYYTPDIVFTCPLTSIHDILILVKSSVQVKLCYSALKLICKLLFIHVKLMTHNCTLAVYVRVTFTLTAIICHEFLIIISATSQAVQYIIRCNSEFICFRSLEFCYCHSLYPCQKLLSNATSIYTSKLSNFANNVQKFFRNIEIMR